MEEQRISFVSAKNRGMTIDLYLLKEYLKNEIPDAMFRYWVASENTGNYMVRQSLNESKNEFCREMDTVICVDASLGMIQEWNKDAKSILIAIPYNHYFQPVLDRNVFEKFTHILAPSPYIYNILKSDYNVQKAEVIQGVTPLAWILSREHYCEEIKSEIETFFSMIKGKKIVYICCSGNVSKEKFDIKEFLHKLGKEWFVFTNCQEIMEQAYSLGAEYKNSFACVEGIFPSWKILAITDVLYSNMSDVLCEYAVTGKPMYCLLGENNDFQNYMQNHYPGLCVTFSDMVKSKKDIDEITEFHEKFLKEFSYESSENPCKIIKKILE